MQFQFADHVLDVARRELRRSGEPIALEPQVFDLLVHLISNRDRVVTKDDLVDSVWGGRIVSESTLTQLSHRCAFGGMKTAVFRGFATCLSNCGAKPVLPMR
jgi:DNA-binding winged helix-turn-helix (wHTH) protein